MEWLKVQGKIINLKNLKALERKGRYVIFYFVNDDTPLPIPFNNEAEARSWFEGFWASLELQAKNPVIALDTTNWDLTEVN